MGAGRIAELHVRALNSIAAVSIAGVCDIAASKAEALIARHALEAQCFSDVTDAVRAIRPDYVALLTPRTVRLPTVEVCVAQQVPVLMEKPPCHDLATGEAIQRLLADSGLVHAVGFMSRYNEALDSVLTQIGDQHLSVIQFTYQSPMATQPVYEDYPAPYLVEQSGGLVGDQGIHCVDLARYVAQSEPRKILALGTNQRLPQSAQVTTCDAAAWMMEMANGVLVSHAHTWAAVGWACQVRLVTDRSDATVDLFGNTAQGTIAGESFSYCGDQADPECFSREHCAFVEAIQTGSMAPVRSPYADALQSFLIAEEINQQLYSSDAKEW